MNNPKIENMLNLALDANPEERARSLNLDVGFDREEKTWEVIVKHSGSLLYLEEEGITVTELRNEYAVLNVPEFLVNRLAEIPEIEYIEKPKRLFFAAEQGRAASCITGVQNVQNGLFGEGVLVAVLDSGVDYSHPDFRTEDGKTRIAALWDQTIPGRPPSGYRIGTEYTREQIDEALAQENPERRRELVPSTDGGGHGTRVLGIAAGNGRASGGRYRGVASKSQLLVVKLGIPGREDFPRTTELMQGLDYCIGKALDLGLPLSVNISFGNTYGAHDGTSLLETYISDVANLWKSVICIGTGNEGYSAGHYSGRLFKGQIEEVELAVGEYEPSLNLQIWKSYLDDADISLVSPGGKRVGPLQNILGPQRFSLEDTELLLYYGEPSPYSQSQEIYIEFLPKISYVTPGVWKIILVPGSVKDGQIQMWLPASAALNAPTRFLRPSAETTLTIPSTARRIIAVGAYDSRSETYADFSGRGNTRDERSRPSLAAPGVAVMAPSPGGGYAPSTGTSFAAPFVTGCAALLMEWGMIEGNDEFLYGEKIRAYLEKGARPLPAFREYPNPQVGWGALCLRNSFPV